MRRLLVTGLLLGLVALGILGVRELQADAAPPPPPIADAGARLEPLASARALFDHRLDRPSLDAALLQLDALDAPEALLLSARAHRFRAEAFELWHRPLNVAPGLADLQVAIAQAEKLGERSAPGLVERAEAKLTLSRWSSPNQAAALLQEVLALATRAEALEPDLAHAAPRRLRGMALASLPSTAGGDLRAARFELERAIARAPGWVQNRVAATRVAVVAQDRASFHALLRSALALDVDAEPAFRPEQLRARAHALRLLRHEAGLFHR